jgi:hypothetical protein
MRSESKIILNVGDKVGKWTLIKEFKHDNYFHDTRYECQCNCGTIKIVRRYSLSRKLSTQCKSCARTKHGGWGTSTYVIWESMIKRCSNPNTKHYSYYGGRGIKVFEHWKKFENFVSDIGFRPPGLELDRIDPNGNYEPGNCRWITKKENMNNTRRSKKYKLCV